MGLHKLMAVANEFTMTTAIIGMFKQSQKYIIDKESVNMMHLFNCFMTYIILSVTDIWNYIRNVARWCCYFLISMPDV